MSNIKGPTGIVGSVGATGPTGPGSGGYSWGASSSYISGATGAIGRAVYYDNYEPYLEDTIKNLLFANHKDKESGIRNFILAYIKNYKAFIKLREAVIDVCPEQEVLLDKLIPLKE
jgi:hypothetical protein